MTAHAKLSASSAHRWMRCAGSVRLSKGLPSPATRNAAEGTVAHKVAASALDGTQPAQRWLGKRVIEDDKFEIEVTQEMVDFVQSYVDDIVDDRLPEDSWFVEVDLTPALSKLHPSLGGTADYANYRPSTKALRVRDLKYGAGVLIDVKENKQAMIYALGALLTLKLPCETVQVTIDQPRAEHPDGRSRSYAFASYRLLEFASELVDAAKATESPDALLVADADKQCRWCPAKPTCPELEKSQHALMAQDFADVPAITPERLSIALGLIPEVKARIKAIEEEAYRQANQGLLRPEHGWKLVEKRPTRQWRDETEVVAWAVSQAVDPYEQSVLSPAQLEKRIADAAPKGEKKMAKTMLDPFVVKVSSGTALVSVDDKRPEVKRLESKDFAEVDGTAQGQDQPAVNLFT